MADKRRDKTFLFPATTPEELLASKRRLASKQHITLPHGMPAVDEAAELPSPVIIGEVHRPEAGKIPPSQVEAALSGHLDAFLEEPRASIVTALCARKYTEAAAVAEAEAKRFPKNLSLAKAASGVRHYALARLEADLGALFASPRLVKSVPAGLARDLHEALRRVDGKTPIETILREAKVDRLRALDGFAWLARAGFMEIPRVATPSPGAFVIPIANPAVIREKAPSKPDEAPPREPASPEKASTPIPPALTALPDLDPGPPKRSLSLQGLPSPSSIPSPSCDGAPSSHPAPQPAERAPISSAPPEPIFAVAPISVQPEASSQPPVSSTAPTSQGPRPTEHRPTSQRPLDLPQTPVHGLELGIAPRKRRSSAAPVLAGVAALSVAAVAFTIARTGPESSNGSSAHLAPAPIDPAPSSAPQTRLPEPTGVAPAPAPKPETVAVEIDVTPKFARVFIDGVLFTGSPIRVTMPKDGKTHEVRVESPGFAPRTTTFVTDANASLILALNRLPPKPPTP
ncbi:MAG: PEGA domain-containing protein [Polyangiaceae bacterium]|nr:PEGA domain-containing protein [Polyangiaceae bacterium]